MQGLRDYMAGRLEGGTAPFETVPPCFISWYQKVRFEESGMDVSGLSYEELEEMAEVFSIGDGTYLIVEA